MKRTGREFAEDPVILNEDKLDGDKDKLKQDLVIRWYLSCGYRLVFEREKERNAPYRVTRIIPPGEPDDY
jgi:hypothetical protein